MRPLSPTAAPEPKVVPRDWSERPYVATVLILILAAAIGYFVWLNAGGFYRSIRTPPPPPSDMNTL